jgi:hypothetical protein
MDLLDFDIDLFAAASRDSTNPLATVRAERSVVKPNALAAREPG